MRLHLLLFILCSAHLLHCVTSKRGGSSGSRGMSRARHSNTRRMVKKTAKSGSIERTQLFRSAVFGATAGYLTYQGARGFIRSPFEPIIWDSRRYYWDPVYMPPSDTLPVQCANPIDPQDPQLGRVFFPNETRPREIVWGCAEGNQCCGYECCTDSGLFSAVLRLALLIFVMAFIGLCVIESFRWLIHCFYQFRNKDFEPVSTTI